VKAKPTDLTAVSSNTPPNTGPFQCRGGHLHLPIRRVQQVNPCGCGLAALEMVLRYYGADVQQLDFLSSDESLRNFVEREDSRGLPEAEIGLLALKRGFKVTIYGENLKVPKTFLSLGGKLVRKHTNSGMILRLLRKGVPPIVRLPSAEEAYGKDFEDTPHYVVVTGGHKDNLEVADPAYEKRIPKEYWSRWNGSIIAIERKIG
jgi:ABC-type bacteriocin/lantibiotic exporter with double-glycine peptidase domain